MIGNSVGVSSTKKHLNPRRSACQREIDELLVLVAVADDVATIGIEIGQRDQEFGLAPGLQTMAVARPDPGNLLDHRALLIDP